MVAAIAAGVFFTPTRPAKVRWHRCTPNSPPLTLRNHRAAPRSGINYDIIDRGATVQVPENDIYEARLLIERAGEPEFASATVSTRWPGITSTQFQQRIATSEASHPKSKTRSRNGVGRRSLEELIPEQTCSSTTASKPASVVEHQQSTHQFASHRNRITVRSS